MAHEIGHNLGAQHFNDKDNKFQYIMESKISTGADGFGDSSINSILGFLGRSDIKCYQTISALQDATPTPTSLPIPPPTAPVSPPVPAPVASPTAPLDDCYGAVLDALPNCLAQDNDNKFVCFNLKEELIPTSCKVRFFLSDKCEKFFNRRSLVDEGSNSSGGGDSSKGKGSMQVPTFEGIFEETGVEETNEGTFGADDCTNSCLYSQKKICFSASEGTSHAISFAVLNDQGDTVGSTVSLTLTVENNGSGCAVPDLQCID